MADLSRIGERERLKPRAGDEPNWQRLRASCYVGYRPSKRGGKGSWFARAYDPDSRKSVRKPLGSFGALSGHDVFAAAKRDAETWAEQVECGGVLTEKVHTVADACRAYLKDKPGQITEGVFRRHVYADVLAKVSLDKLRRHHLRAWRKRLESTPALISRSSTGEPRTKARSASTVNRDMVPLRAALGRVLAPGAPGTEGAWQEALRPQSGADKRRDLYLSRDERRQLITAAADEIAPLLKGLCLLPLRPGTLARLLVGAIDPRTRTLTIGADKSGRSRQIALPPSTSEFLMEQARPGGPGAPIFARADGRPWNKDAWKGPIKDAVANAKLPSGVTAYTLRHSIITDLIRDGLPALTVAQLADTSIAMIEKHYGHLAREDAEQALARLTL